MSAVSVRVLVMLAWSILMPLSAGATEARAIRVDQAWIHSASKRQFEIWAFATIINSGGADALVEVRSPTAASVVLRAATVTDAGRKMRSVVSIPVPARATLTLSPDTYFIAFIENQGPLVAGEAIPATFRFASGAVIPVVFKVSEAEGDPVDSGN